MGFQHYTTQVTFSVNELEAFQATVYARVGNLIVATIYLQLIQNR